MMDCLQVGYSITRESAIATIVVGSDLFFSCSPGLVYLGPNRHTVRQADRHIGTEGQKSIETEIQRDSQL